jgi:hypothetical protein
MHVDAFLSWKVIESHRWSTLSIKERGLHDPSQVGLLQRRPLKSEIKDYNQ